ncbi:MAG: hypothetical protein HOO06_03235 [Bdellovibrionaceae bacterium]|jgi:organic hydroperoxide reductase OsmC/OhrA|nr:hypothetical protein [Pseudobdellovibrionaceae bacterium]
MPAAFPHTYKVNLSEIHSAKATLHCEQAPVVLGGAPPQFDGLDSHWSPETLFISSIALCYVTTLAALKKKHESLEIREDDINIEGILDKTKEGLVFTQIALHVTCSTNDKEKAIRILENAKKYCLISNALKCPTVLNLTLNEL